MKKLLAITAAAAVMAMAGSVMAADSNTLTVSASVTGTCKFSSPTSTLNFGALDPSVGTNVNGSTTTNFWCTKGVSTDAIVAGNGLNFAVGKRQMKDAVSTDVIPYTLTLTKDGNANVGPATPRTLTVAGNVLGTDYTAKTAGSYSDTVVLNITP
jgi:spore coat protein U-like protein